MTVHRTFGRRSGVAVLPPDGTGAQYHVRSERDGMQRRVYKEQLAPTH
jgi:hypothetical protein